MKHKKLKINDLLNSKSETNKEAKNTLDKIARNYERIKEDAYKMAIYSLDNSSKPTIYYNLFYYIEVSCKYYLILNSEIPISDIENLGHKIIKLIDKSNEYGDFNDLYFMIERIVQLNNLDDLSKYYNYRYNKKIDSNDLIFDFNISENEKNIIKEVIEWIRLHI